MENGSRLQEETVQRLGVLQGMIVISRQESDTLITKMDHESVAGHEQTHSGRVKITLVYLFPLL